MEANFKFQRSVFEHQPQDIIFFISHGLSGCQNVMQCNFSSLWQVGSFAMPVSSLSITGCTYLHGSSSKK